MKTFLTDFWDTLYFIQMTLFILQLVIRIILKFLDVMLLSKRGPLKMYHQPMILFVQGFSIRVLEQLSLASIVMVHCRIGESVTIQWLNTLDGFLIVHTPNNFVELNFIEKFKKQKELNRVCSFVVVVVIVFHRTNLFFCANV